VTSINQIKRELRQKGDPVRAEHSRRFFKTGKGQYGEGDVFLGLSVPEMREIAKKYKDLELSEIEKLLRSKIHEERFTAIEILNFKYKDALAPARSKIVNFYLKYKEFVNNWDLVDDSAPYILGNWLLDKDTKILHKLAGSKSLWDRRIAIVATFAFIKNDRFKDTLEISEKLLDDDEDLIHKAVGWMLREVGKKDIKLLEKFLAKHASHMPRTALRHAIERFPESKREKYLKISG